MGVFGTSAGTEPGVDGYLRGQVFNREVPEDPEKWLQITALIDLRNYVTAVQYPAAPNGSRASYELAWGYSDIYPSLYLQPRQLSGSSSAGFVGLQEVIQGRYDYSQMASIGHNNNSRYVFLRAKLSVIKDARLLSGLRYLYVNIAAQMNYNEVYGRRFLNPWSYQPIDLNIYGDRTFKIEIVDKKDVLKQETIPAMIDQFRPRSKKIAAGTFQPYIGVGSFFSSSSIDIQSSSQFSGCKIEIDLLNNYSCRIVPEQRVLADFGNFISSRPFNVYNNFPPSTLQNL